MKDGSDASHLKADRKVAVETADSDNVYEDTEFGRRPKRRFPRLFRWTMKMAGAPYTLMRRFRSWLQRGAAGRAGKG